MDIGQLLKTAVKLYVDHWKLLAGIAAIVLVPYIFLVDAFIAASGVASFQPGVSPPPEAALRALGFSFVVLVLALLATPLVTAAMVRAAADISLGRQVTLGDAYRIALNRLGSILLVLILAGLLVLGTALLLIIPAAIIVGLAGQDPRPWIPFVAVPLVFGAVFFTFAIAIRVSFAPMVVMLEPARGTEAVGRSWRLAKGYGWRIAGAILLMVIISAVVSFLLSFPFTRLAETLGAGGWLLSAVGEAIANVVITPFSTLVIVLLYFDLRIRKEGWDPSLIAQEPPPPPSEGA